MDDRKPEEAQQGHRPVLPHESPPCLMAAFEKIDDPELIRDIEASWNNEQRSATGYANMLTDAVHQLADEREKVSKRVAEGRCPHCGVRLTAPRGGVPDNAAVYCSNCGKRVR